MTTDMYSGQFFDSIRDSAERSGREVVPLLMAVVAPRSVIDVGCGTGAWLDAFRDHGIVDACGVDGEWARGNFADQTTFIAADLTQPFECARSFDLVLSVEVAEHLPPTAARGFVQSLVRLGPVVMFSAAIPHQNGTNHVNEQWPEYWADLFAQFGYVPIDCIRPRLWNNPRVAWWYAQNAILYVDERRLESVPTLRASAAATDRARLSLVHPRAYLSKIEEFDGAFARPDARRFSFTTVAALLPALAVNAMRRRIAVLFSDWRHIENRG
jgi:SAM-dependent methyltransferase